MILISQQEPSLKHGTVILQIFGVVLLSVVIGFTEIKKTPTWEKYVEYNHDNIRGHGN